MKGLDYLGRELQIKDEEMDSIEMVASYLKLINVPCMFDIGVTNCTPEDNQLNLHIVDDITYNQVLKPDFYNDTSLRS